MYGNHFPLQGCYFVNQNLTLKAGTIEEWADTIAWFLNLLPADNPTICLLEAVWRGCKVFSVVSSAGTEVPSRLWIAFASSVLGQGPAGVLRQAVPQCRAAKRLLGGGLSEQ
jgi:hypothetical protein